MIAVREREDMGMTVIEPGARLTLENAGDLLKIIEALPGSLQPLIVINMHKLSIIDSSGIGALVQAKKTVQAASGQFVLVALRPEISRMFKLMNLHEIFDMLESEELAHRVMTLPRR